MGTAGQLGGYSGSGGRVWRVRWAGMAGQLDARGARTVAALDDVTSDGSAATVERLGPLDGDGRVGDADDTDATDGLRHSCRQITNMC